jgi:hypothetical protein
MLKPFSKQADCGHARADTDENGGGKWQVAGGK